MNIVKHIEHWQKSAKEDLEFAERTIRKGTRNSLFFAQLALEKILKALYCKVNQDIPPRIHNLVKLAEYDKVELAPEQWESLGALSEFNLSGRYPEFGIKEVSLAEAKAHLKTAKELYLCFQRLL